MIRSLADARVLVVDGHTTSALSVVRSLGRAGAVVTVATEAGRMELAGLSRWVSRRVRVPSTALHPEGWIGSVREELVARRHDLVVPTTDTALALLAAARGELEGVATLAMAPAAVLELATDKAQTIELARAGGVRVPESHVCRSVEEVCNVAGMLSFPVVVKPRISRVWSGGGAVTGCSARYARTADELLNVFELVHRQSPGPLVQEQVTGHGVGVFALMNHGVPLAVFVHRRLREENPSGGPASLAESLAPESRLVSPAIRLLESALWHGVAMVEFKDPGAPADPILMEINGRFWGSLPLAVAAGVDFPLMAAQLHLGRPVDVPRRPYDVGVRCRHLRGDISHLVGVFKGRPPDWRGAFPGRVATLAGVLPWPGRWHAYNFRWSDPLPALNEALEFATEEATRALARVNARSTAGRRGAS